MPAKPSQDRRHVLEEARTEYEKREARSAALGEKQRLAREVIRRRTRRAYTAAMSACDLLPMGEMNVIDLGCGDGDFLLHCRESWGHQGGILAGIDLMENRVERLKRQAPFLDARTGSADQLPWDDNSFDIAHQSMLFSSVLDEDLRRSMASGIHRVVRPGGWMLWYDFVWNPTNKATVGMPLAVIRSYFPDWIVRWRRRITLAPPISRPLARISETLVRILEACKLLNFFELVLLQDPRGPGPRHDRL